MLTQSRLKEILIYDQEAGLFRRKIDVGGAKIGDIAGTDNGDGYLKIRVDGKSYKAHRLAWLYVMGRWPEKDIDHINGVRCDNRIVNLREATRAENKQNTRTANVNNGSGMLGAVRRNDRWQAKIRVNGKQLHLGTFDTAEDANAAYLKAKATIHPFSTL